MSNTSAILASHVPPRMAETGAIAAGSCPLARIAVRFRELTVALGLRLVTMATCYVPARRAMGIEPATLLRQE
jgi:hypothetical protein